MNARKTFLGLAGVALIAATGIFAASCGSNGNPTPAMSGSSTLQDAPKLSSDGVYIPCLVIRGAMARGSHDTPGTQAIRAPPKRHRRGMGSSAQAHFYSTPNFLKPH